MVKIGAIKFDVDTSITEIDYKNYIIEILDLYYNDILCLILIEEIADINLEYDIDDNITILHEWDLKSISDMESKIRIIKMMIQISGWN